MKKPGRPGPKKVLPDPLMYGRPFLSAEEFAECMGLTRAEGYKFIRNNKIPMAKNGKRYLIPALIAKDIQNGEFFHNQKS